MLKSSNFDSIIINSADRATFNPASAQEFNNSFSLLNELPEPPLPLDNSTFDTLSSEITLNNAKLQPTNNSSTAVKTSLGAAQMTEGVLQIFEPPLSKAISHLKELICKQNKILIDLSAEKFKLDNAEITKVGEMMNNVKIYREKLIKIKKQMQNIYQRSKVLKKRADYIQACKHKELQRKLTKQQQEEDLIAK